MSSRQLSLTSLVIVIQRLNQVKPNASKRGSGNAYPVQAEQPPLVDSGLPTSRPDFLQTLLSQIEPADLRWIYLTHPDRDHTGSLMEILEAAPAARLITTFLGLGILSLEYQIGLDRIFLLNSLSTSATAA